MTPPLPDLVLYGRPGCHLCDDARVALAAILSERTARHLPVPLVVERDIDADERLHERYAFTIPVVALGEQELELATSPARLRRFIADALDDADLAGDDEANPPHVPAGDTRAHA